MGVAPRRTPPVPDPGPGRAPGGLHPLGGAGQLAGRARQQPHIGRVRHIRADDRGVHPQLAPAQQLVAGQLANQRSVELVDHAGAGAPHQLAQGRGVRDGLVQGNAGEATPGDRV